MITTIRGYLYGVKLLYRRIKEIVTTRTTKRYTKVVVVMPKKPIQGDSAILLGMQLTKRLRKYKHGNPTLLGASHRANAYSYNVKSEDVRIVQSLAHTYGGYSYVLQ